MPSEQLALASNVKITANVLSRFSNKAYHTNHAETEAVHLTTEDNSNNSDIVRTMYNTRSSAQ